MRRTLRRFGALAATLVCLLAVYTAAMLAAYAIPDEAIEENVQAALGVLEEEGNMPGGYATYFWHNGYGIADLVTDKEMFRGLMRNGRSVAEAAMRTDYPRYWHGYAVFLRPVMVFASIINLRYLNMMLMGGLFLACFWRAGRALGKWAAFVFAAGLIMSFILLAPFCQQYCTVYYLTLLGCCAVLAAPRGLRADQGFLALGSMVCFFDFLTFPVLALGYPLVLHLTLAYRRGEGAGRLWKSAVGLSALWMAGYGLTWMSKALIGWALTGQNVLSDILSNVATRTGGMFESVEGNIVAITRWDAIRINLESFFMGSNAAFYALLLAALGIRALVRRRPLADWARALPIAAVSAYPFLWYAALQNHTRLHFWMTYRMLAVTVLASCFYLLAVSRGALAPLESAARLGYTERKETCMTQRKGE